MRIITGKYKGRQVKRPKCIRPTQNKVRKALFDILGDVEGLSFLELFSGSGAVGIEALSQGAKEVVFVESNSDCLRILRDNLSCLLPTAYCLLSMDSARAIQELTRKRFKFDIIFLDPPYYKGQVPRLRSGLVEIRDSASLAKKTLQILGAYDILAPNGFIVAQHFKKENLPVQLGDLTLFKQSKYGDTVLSFYKKCAK